MEDLIEIHNGEPVAHTFSEAEYAERHARIRAHMAAAALDAVGFTS